MKIRNDFVTNSSSSSFVIARKGELTDAQKAAIIKFVEENFLGEKMLTPESSEEEIKDVVEDYYLEDVEQKLRDTLAKGADVYIGGVGMHEAEYQLDALYQRLWKTLARLDAENFVEIDTEIIY